MPEIQYFPVFIGLLSPEHREKIGPAIWEFLWFIARTTKEFREGGDNLGIVLGGKPVKYSEIAQELGISESSVKKHVAILKKYDYVDSKKTPYGDIYIVKNSKKFKKNRQTKNGLSETRDRPNLVQRQTKNGLSNKDIKDIKVSIDIKQQHIKDGDVGLLKNPFLEYEKAFGVLPPTLIDEFNHWIDNSQFTEPELIICEAIKKAEKQIPRNPAKYIIGILENWHRMELYSLTAVREYNEKFDKKISLETHKKKKGVDWEAL